MGGGNIGGGSVEMNFDGGGNNVKVKDTTAVPTAPGGHDHVITVKFPTVPTPVGASGKEFKVTVSKSDKIKFEWP